jgi:Na+/H+ antiporter NhaD/arsenite permease-like protein
MAKKLQSGANILPDTTRPSGTVRNYLKRLKWERYILLIIIALTLYLLFITGLLWMKVHAYTNLWGVRLEFILFGLTLAGVALFHRHTMWVALAGLILIISSQVILFPSFSIAGHIFGSHMNEGEWKTLLNLLGLLLGFTILARHFEESGVPGIMPRILPGGWPGALLLLFFIMVMSTFIDNIAAAMLGGTMAFAVYRGRVHLGYMASIVAASNAGGAGSVVGDTTTTLMWIEGVPPSHVLHAFYGTLGSFLIFGTLGSWVQARHIKKHSGKTESGILDPVKQAFGKISFAKLMIVVAIIISAILTNYFFGMPALGVWLAILAGSFLTHTSWSVLGKSVKGTIFLLALVLSASLMPVKELPEASMNTTFFLGFLSSVFDNIPLTKLALEGGGYDWGLLAYAVGFGGSMVWFGSSAGVALSNLFPELRSVWGYLKSGWYIIPAYIAGFALIMLFHGWRP